MRFKSRYTSKYRSKYTSAYGETVFIGGGPSDAAPSVDTPSITSPADDAVNVAEDLTLTSSAFAVTGDTDTHASSDWQIASDADFNTVVVQTLADATNKTSWAVPTGNLSANTEYFARVRHTGTTYGNSSYSATVSFTVTQVTAPSITSPADAATDIGETPTITTSAFAVTGDTDTHASTDWQIASDAAFTTIVVQSIDDTSNKVSWTVPSGNLSTSTEYFIRARHTGTTYGDSAYSATVSFTTAAAFGYAWTNSEGSAFEAQADTTGWDDTLRSHIDQLISDLKSGQVNATNTYSGFDRILLCDLPNSADSLRYLNAPTLTATNVSATAHTANEGFTGDGVADYIDTGYNPTADGTNHIQDSASVGVWVRAVGSSGTRYYVAPASLTIPNTLIRRLADGSAWQAFGPNSISAAAVSSTLSQNATGLLVANRSAADACQAYRNGASDGSDTIASDSLLNQDMFLLRAATTYHDGQVSLWFAGRSFPANEQADIYDAFNRYRAAREAEAIIAEMSPAPDAARQTLIHNLVYGLHADGIWTKLDRLWIMAAHSSQPARLDWKAPATAGRMLTPVSAPTFTANQGYTGNGTSSYLNTGFTPSTDGVNWTQNSASLGVWVRTAGSTSKSIAGVRTGGIQELTSIFYQSANSYAITAPNGPLSVLAAITATTGLIGINRSGASACESYLDGVQQDTDTGASTALATGPIYILARNVSGSANAPGDAQISAAYVAGSLDATEQSNLYSRLNTYMTGL